ncbi:MgtC/SapB family protein [Telmatocola sphagniphila]|uniref:Protein MgtC n=1 Tax=Telmatocola sphagniphila TaxID=1123043 RepID=A0A8E6B8A7_9BACT|nr:MgtC/SapB family protein [Telmatocola sphagniphila]QVL33197.1 MgtC/SapB family protein [Telmatocola sphagniphila]
MHSWQFMLNIFLAILFGAAIGFERQWRHHTAGLRTNTLVSLGAAMFVSLSLLMDDKASPTRIASYIVSGLGFLGGGVILRDGMNVKGINTAATIWCTGAIGTLSGAGFLIEALTGTIAILFVNIGLRPVVAKIETRRRIAPDVETYYRVRIRCKGHHEAVVRMILLRHVGANERMSILSLATDESEKDGPMVVAEIYAVERNDRFMEDIIARVSIEPDVLGASWEKVQT